MRVIPFSMRSLVLTSLATGAIVLAACGDSGEGPEPLEITKMRLQIGPGNGLTNARPPYYFRPGAADSANNIAVLSGIGQTPGLDTQVVVSWVREDNTVQKNIRPALAYRAVITDSMDARGNGLDIKGRYYDGYGFSVKAPLALPASGVAVRFYLLNGNMEQIFGPVIVTFKTP
jgi:hypothetical protein